MEPTAYERREKEMNEVRTSGRRCSDHLGGRRPRKTRFMASASGSLLRRPEYVPVPPTSFIIDGYAGAVPTYPQTRMCGLKS